MDLGVWAYGVRAARPKVIGVAFPRCGFLLWVVGVALGQHLSFLDFFASSWVASAVRTCAAHTPGDDP